MDTSSNQNQSNVLSVSLWVVQALLAGAFGIAGFMKLSAPIAELETQMAWTGDIPAALVRFIGVAELLGAIGLLLPSITQIKPALVIYAAWGLTLVMTFAIIFHIYRGEYQMIGFNAVLGGMAAFVGWGRSR